MHLKNIIDEINFSNKELRFEVIDEKRE